MAEPVVVPETLRLDPLLRLLRSESFQLAVVVDEYGGTAGVVTLEDVVEEIVGDISDEHDPIGAQARQRPDGSWSLSGLLRPDEASDVTGIRLPEHDEYDTIAGLLLRELGRIPEPGDTVEVRLPVVFTPEGEPTPERVAVLTVERMAGLRIDRIGVSSRLVEDAGEQ